MTGNCFACDRPLKQNRFLVDTRDAQKVYVGPECFKKVKAADPIGHLPPLGGPALYLIEQPVDYSTGPYIGQKGK